MEKIQNSAVEEEPQPTPTTKPKKHKKMQPVKRNINDQNSSKLSLPNKPTNYEDSFNKYSRQANEPLHERHKRATRLREENKNTCSLYIQTDPLIWKHIREGFPEVCTKYIRTKL